MTVQLVRCGLRIVLVRLRDRALARRLGFEEWSTTGLLHDRTEGFIAMVCGKRMFWPVDPALLGD
jgi:hypothetical protein